MRMSSEHLGPCAFAAALEASRPYLAGRALDPCRARAERRTRACAFKPFSPSARRWLLAGALSAAVLGLRGSAARAQDEAAAAQESPPEGGAPSLTDSLTGQAKLDYEAGRILFADRDYAGAFVKFQQAFYHAGDVRLLWNMAVCEKNLRHYANVLGLLERYKREGIATMSDAHLLEVESVLATVQTLISRVTVSVNEPGARIFVDDRLAGTAPLSAPLLIDLGKRRLRVSKPGFIEQTVVQEFGGGSSMSFHFDLRPAPTEAQLTISAEGMINIDGKPLAERYWSGSLPAGEHAVRITAPGMLPYEREVVLQAGQSRSLNITLAPEKSGVPTLVWIGAGVLAAGGLAMGGYFLFREPAEPNVYIGTLEPGIVHVGR